MIARLAHSVALQRAPRYAGLLASALLAGTLPACTCEGAPAAPAPAVGETDTTPAAAPFRLARATRTDLPRVTHGALVIVVRPAAFDVDPTALVASADAAERARATGQDAPTVTTVPAPDGDALAVPALGDALHRATDLGRAIAVAGGATPSMAVALRVAADAPWRRVLQALYAAGQVGLSVPVFVLRAASGDEVMLVLTLPRVSSAIDPETRRALNELLGTDDGEPFVLPEVDPALTVQVDDAGAVALRFGDRALGPGCAPSDAPDPAIPARAGAPDADALGRCLDAVDLYPRSAILVADGALPFSSVAPLLEALHARGDLAIAVTP